ncbi:MAG: hypothetical protein OM95_11195 [Bdellovibrio sp. ArHS]|nr:MAG: hypothetical protein OM95_11195 [Bdellovibrio sp. ArHS]
MQPSQVLGILPPLVYSRAEMRLEHCENFSSKMPGPAEILLKGGNYQCDKGSASFDLFHL